MPRENIHFRRNRPAHFNLGDFLCTPLHYFDFDVNEYQTQVFLRGKAHKTILGGGAYNDLGVGQDVDFGQTVAWGLGSSQHGPDSLPTNADDLPYLLYGVRDPDAVSEDGKILPCVSCLHPLVMLPPGAATNVFLNFDHGITNMGQARQHSLFQGPSALGLYTNNLPELAFMKAFSESGRIITNSFHVAYWSLLSGRRVSIIGYSSKFRSLLKLVGLSPALQSYYSVSDQAALIDSIGKIVGADEFYSLPKHGSLRDDCIQRNLRFAQRCVDIGFVRTFALKTHARRDMVLRLARYQPIQWVQRLSRDR